jgi:hypothetical protein
MLLLPGGRGNTAFKSGINKVPRIAEKREKGPKMYVFLPTLFTFSSMPVCVMDREGGERSRNSCHAHNLTFANHGHSGEHRVVNWDLDSTMAIQGFW